MGDIRLKLKKIPVIFADGSQATARVEGDSARDDCAAASPWSAALRYHAIACPKIW